MSIGKMVGNLKKKSDNSNNNNNMVISSPVLTGDSTRLSQSRVSVLEPTRPENGGSLSSRSSQKEARQSRDDIDE